MINIKELTIWPCASYEPALWNFLVDISHIHTSKDPEPLPTARNNEFAECTGTIRESTETGTESTVMTYVEEEITQMKMLVSNP